MKIVELRTQMKERGIDAVMVTDEINQNYLLNFSFTDGLLLITEKSAYMITDFRYSEEAKKKADPAFRVETPRLRTAFINDAMRADGVKTVGYEDRTLTVAAFQNMQEKYPEQHFLPLGNLLEKLRENKTEEEIVKIRKAQNITDAAFSHLLSILTPNMTETEVAMELEFEMRRQGAEGFAFETIAVSGDASALPHGHPRPVKLKKGFLTMDFGAKYQGYCADMTRTVVIGRADEKMKRLYQTVLMAQQEAITAIRAGMDCSAVDEIARQYINKAGYEGCFGHSLGHGVGLYIHENPRLSSSAVGEVLQTGQVVTVEPGIYINDLYGCRIEDMVLVQTGGCSNFTCSTKELIEIL